jgi:hypothetical protein
LALPVILVLNLACGLAMYTLLFLLFGNDDGLAALIARRRRSLNANDPQNGLASVALAM